MIYKYNEDIVLEDITAYIQRTYSGPYANKDGIQVNDLLIAIGLGEGAFLSNAIEYLARYGRKDGRNIKDLQKAIHNIVLLLNLNHYGDHNWPEPEDEGLDLTEDDDSNSLDGECSDSCSCADPEEEEDFEDESYDYNDYCTNSGRFCEEDMGIGGRGYGDGWTPKTLDDEELAYVLKSFVKDRL